MDVLGRLLAGCLLLDPREVGQEGGTPEVDGIYLGNVHRTVHDRVTWRNQIKR